MPSISSLLDGWNLQQPEASAYKRQLLQAPTGAGKTFIFNYIADCLIESGHAPVLVLCHRVELVKQAAQKFWQWFGGHADIIKSGMGRSRSFPFKVASIQTLHARLKKKTVEEIFGIVPTLVIVDECHHLKAKSWLEVINAFPDSLLLGVSATPIRMDGTGFSECFDRLVPFIQVRQLEDIWKADSSRLTGLVPDLIHQVKLIPDARKLKVKAGEYDMKPLNEILNTDETCQTVVNFWKAHGGGDEQTIAFCIKGGKGIEKGHHQRLAETFIKNGVTAAYLDGKTDDILRDQILKGFERKEIQVLCNIEIATEGFDVPNIGCTLMCRPTKSLALHIQMAGRGKRPSAGKNVHIMMDFVGNCLLHGRPNEERSWTLEGIKKKKKKKTLVDVDGQLMDIDDFENMDVDTTGIPMTYEIIEIESDDFRFAGFKEILFNVRENYRNPDDAIKAALAQWYAEVNHSPDIIELTAIARHVFPDQNKANCERWAWSRYEKFKLINQMIDTCQNVRQAGDIIDAIDAVFVQQGDVQIKVPLAGHFGLKTKVTNMIRSRWLPDYVPSAATR
jgi:superfamily II DNA or RNA helicase